MRLDRGLCTGHGRDRAPAARWCGGRGGFRDSGPRAPVLLSQATAERVRTILVEGTSPATSRAHAGDSLTSGPGPAPSSAWPRATPAPLAAPVQFVADHLEGLPPATEAVLLERAALGPAGGQGQAGSAGAGHHRPPHRRALEAAPRRRPQPRQRSELRELLARAGRRQARSPQRRKRAATREVLEAFARDLRRHLGRRARSGAAALCVRFRGLRLRHRRRPPRASAWAAPCPPPATAAPW